MFRANDNEVVKVDGKADEMFRNLFKSKMSKNEKSEVQTYIRAIKKFIFLTPDTREAFNLLKQIFIKASTLQYFGLECYISIKTNASGYTISRMFSELSTNWVASDKANLSKSKILVENLTKSNSNQ